MQLYFFGRNPNFEGTEYASLYTEAVVSQMSESEKSRLVLLTEETAPQLENKILKIRTRTTTESELNNLKRQSEKLNSLVKGNLPGFKRNEEQNPDFNKI